MEYTIFQKELLQDIKYFTENNPSGFIFIEKYLIDKYSDVVSEEELKTQYCELIDNGIIEEHLIKVRYRNYWVEKTKVSIINNLEDTTEQTIEEEVGESIPSDYFRHHNPVPEKILYNANLTPISKLFLIGVMDLNRDYKELNFVLISLLTVKLNLTIKEVNDAMLELMEFKFIIEQGNGRYLININK